MIVYPAIDLRGGVCVRLMQGRFEEAVTYDEDPARRLAAFAAAGAEWVHMVDLDGAEQGAAVQHRLIGELARSVDVKIQAGGGVRSAQEIDRLLSEGVARVVVGSLAVTHADAVAGWLERFGPGRIALAFDVRMQGERPVPALKGWSEAAAVDLWIALEQYPVGTLKHVLVTDVGRDGALTGPNLDLLAVIRRRRTDLALQASGGMASLDDLVGARAIGCAGAIVGRALYEGRFTLEQALAT